jgi:ketosteroid isomerase-like protein
MCVLGATLVAAPLSAQAPAGDTAPLPSVTLPAELDRVLRDYERHWRAGDAASLAQLFAEDGLIMQSGRQPVRGRQAIQAAYAPQARGDLRLRAYAFATSDTTGYILGGYRYGDAPADGGKFTLTLRRARGGQWLIFSDMDNGSQPMRRPGTPPTPPQH